MEIYLKRYSDNGDSTLGLLFIEDKFFCRTLEDEYRSIKIKGETRIPYGRYKLALRDSITPLTKKYRDKYNWFDRHIQLLNVPNFNYVYIHIGNKDEDTDGCILVGNSSNNNQVGKGLLWESKEAYERLYNKIYPLLRNEEDVYINIIDL